MAAGSRRVTVARLITAPILFLVAAGMLVQSIVGLASLALNADTRYLAASIEKGFEPNADYLFRFVSSKGFDRASGDCGNAITRARLTAALAALEFATKGSDLALLDAAEEKALEIAGHRLSCNPLDGNAWLRFAMVDSQASGPSATAINALRLSYWAAPSESWVMDARLPFATRLYLAGVTGFETEYIDDLRRFATYEPTDRVAATYVATPPRIKALLHPLIADQVEIRKKDIVAGIDRLGMLFDAE